MTGVEVALRARAADGARARVQTQDGRTLVGVLVPVDGEPHTFKVMTGKRGRPAKIHADDVKSVGRAA